MSFIASNRQIGTGSAATGATTIATAGTYQTLFAAGSMVNGAFLQVPTSSATGVWVDIAGATGTTVAATSQYIVPGGEYLTSIPFANAITVMSSSTITFQAGTF